MDIHCLPADVWKLITDKLSLRDIIALMGTAQKIRNVICNEWTGVSGDGVSCLVKLQTMSSLVKFVERIRPSFPTTFKWNIKLCKIDVTSVKEDVMLALGDVHSLELTRCTGVTDVSMVGNVHKLVLTKCTGVTDVSALGSVHSLYLFECTGVKDVSALGRVHKLHLDKCTGVTDVSMLGRVHKLILRRCIDITDVSMLDNVRFHIRL